MCFFNGFSVYEVKATTSTQNTEVQLKNTTNLNFLNVCCYEKHLKFLDPSLNSTQIILAEKKEISSSNEPKRCLNLHENLKIKKKTRDSVELREEDNKCLLKCFSNDFNISFDAIEKSSQVSDLKNKIINSNDDFSSSKLSREGTFY